MRNIGPRSQAMLCASGFTDDEQIRQTGPVPVYLIVRQHFPRVTENLLWSLYAGLHNRDWRSLTDAEKAMLRSECLKLG